MQLLPVLSTLSALLTLSLTQAQAPSGPGAFPCFRTYGWIQQITQLTPQTTVYLPSIYLEQITTVYTPNTTICDGQFPLHSNRDQPDFIPGGVPTNISFAGPWGAFNCSDPYRQVDVFGVNGQVLVRDYERATWLNPEDLDWKQVATAQGVAGFPDERVSVWTWDSGLVGCGS